jgi:vacuolar-type H+-ATPase subunit I/STV1
MNKEKESKENESIYLFIIEEEYKRNKAKQNADADSLKKPEPPPLITQDHADVILELENMHPSYKVFQEPKPRRTLKRPKQIESPQVAEPSNAPNALDLFGSFQKMKTEEQELLEQKQELLTTIQALHDKLTEEINKEKTVVNNLKTEIADLQNRCKKLAQTLESPQTISML